MPWSEAGQFVAIIVGAFTAAGLVGALIDKRMKDHMRPVQQKLDWLTAEVDLDGGQSLKDGVKALADHMGVEFHPAKVGVRHRGPADPRPYRHGPTHRYAEDDEE